MFFDRPPLNVDPQHSLLFRNARLIDSEQRMDMRGELLVVGGVITEFAEKIPAKSIPANAEIIECNGNVLCPGLLDIQVHLREPGFSQKETIETGTQSAAAGGVTTVVAMANTSPVIDSVEVVRYVESRIKESAYVNVLMYGAITKGLAGEQLTDMGMLADAGVVGFSDDGKPVMNSLVMRRAMEYASSLGVVIAQHAEDTHLSNGGCINEGHVSAKLGVTGVPNASEAVIVARDLLLQELAGGHYHVLHISTWQAIEAVRRAKAQGLNVTCEAAPHHFALTDEAVLEHGTLAKMNPPLRAEKDRLAIITGLKDGTIDVIATDHAPHEASTKDVPLSEASFGIIGLETMLPLSLQLYHSGQVDLLTILGAMTYKAADVIHRPQLGRLQKNAPADLTLIDLDAEWVLQDSDVFSKSKNMPFAGAAFKGKVLRTYVRGHCVFTR